ncbi:MAG TPA: DUF3160 domain-containing protein [Armatimonadota bacterium]|nr:DUF3160 domain-containing protein [Armatimonadota bacterium]
MKTARYTALVALLVALAMALGCGTTEKSNKQETTTEGLEGKATGVEIPERYLVTITPRAETYPIPSDLGTVGNLAHYAELTNGQKRQLAQVGFVVVPDDALQMFFLYEEYAESADAANFITVDSMLQAYHIFFDYSLRTAEAEHLAPAAEEMTDALLTAAQAQLQAAPAGPVKDAALRNVAYFAVAQRLLKPAARPPDEVADLVGAELALIDAHAARAESPIMGSTIHYTQFNPRGHYTRSEGLGRYFRAMMWYGLVGFELVVRDQDPPDRIELVRRQALQATLICKLLAENPQTAALWEKIYEPTDFFVGGSDDLRYDQLLPVAQAAFGADLSDEALADQTKVDAFIQQAQADLPAPRIAPFFFEGDAAGNLVGKPQVQGLQFRLMGQRFIPDSYILQQLVSPLVGEPGPTTARDMPIGLDVMAALGSARARSLLIEQYKQDRYKNYISQLDKVTGEFAATKLEEWTSNLYWGWLYSLTPLLEPRGQGYPTFMQSEQWQDKELGASLSSWAELRHDTILYAKQSGAEAGAAEPAYPKGYVEPYPEVYGRLAYLAWKSRQGLDSRGMLPEKLATAYDRFDDALLFLKSIAEKELTGEPRTAEEYERIQYFGGELERLTLQVVEGVAYATRWFEITNETDRNIACIADVHTSFDSALEVGVGPAYRIYVVVPHPDGGLQIAKGGVFSYYEFAWPAADRLTDEKWQALLASGQAPAQQEWTESYIVPGGATE